MIIHCQHMLQPPRLSHPSGSKAMPLILFFDSHAISKIYAMHPRGSIYDLQGREERHEHRAESHR